MDVLLTLAALVTSPNFAGVFEQNTREEYEQRIVWQDDRPKPSWADLLAKWPEVEQDIADQATADAFDPALVVEHLAAAAIVSTLFKLPQAQRDAIKARRRLRGKAPV